VLGYVRECLTMSWRLVSYEIYTKIGRHALLWEIWVDFPYLIHVSYIVKIASLISLEKTPGGKLWAVHFLLAPSSHGVMGAPIHLLWESRHVRLVHMADRWAKPPLSVRVAPVADGS
jgi:hypothetical protein